jgi:molybdopterin-containing oxidoreductase family iron-sulfur binding subunit
MVSVPLFKAEPKTGEMLAYVEAIKVERTGSRVRLPIMAGSLALVGRGIVPWPVHRKEREDHGPETLYPEHEHKDYRWAMAIDLELCTGCSACVAACYIENNVPVVGRQEHLIGREMSWIRIEQHRDARGRLNFLPMLCQHCENAPCEPVCPVFAAYHNPQGLNAQIYNRCVGTRYCSNNCPYKVRRFNWFDHDWPSPLDKMLNPELLVRSRGVMEKCTFCIQRIRAAGDRAKDEGRKIRDGEVVPACAQTCPSGAIVFGSILDEESRVWKKAHSERSYRVFEELGTESAVYYLARREPKGGR